MAPLRSTRDRTSEWANRHPNAAVLAVLAYLTVTLGGVLLGGAWLVIHANQDRADIRRMAMAADQQAEAAKRDAAEIHRVLCAVRNDYQQRVAAADAFLEDHPNGIPGITSTDIKRSRDLQQRTVDAMHALRDCGEE